MTFLDWIYRLIRWTIGGTFVYAGLLKLADPASLASVMDAYGLLPDFLLAPAALALPALEVLVGAGLVMDVRGSLTGVAAFLLLFIAVLGYGLWLGLDIDCGCFGPDDPGADAFTAMWSAIYRDIAMLAAAALLFGWRRVRKIRPSRFRDIFKKLTRERSSKNAYA